MAAPPNAEVHEECSNVGHQVAFDDFRVGHIAAQVLRCATTSRTVRPDKRFALDAHPQEAADFEFHDQADRLSA